jgi:hypothetical protein
MIKGLLLQQTRDITTNCVKKRYVLKRVLQGRDTANDVNFVHF